MNMSLTQILAILILAGSILYLIAKMPAIFPVINVVLAIVYALFVLNVIRFQFDPKAILIGDLLVIVGLSVLQLVKSGRKYAAAAAMLQLFAAGIALLVYIKVIDRLLN